MTHPARVLHLTHTRDQSDASLAARLARGESSALDDALRLYWSSVARYATRALSDAESAKDVAQETFIRLWRNRAEIDGEYLRAFLFRTARNLVIDEQRRHAVREREAPTIALYNDAPESPDEIFDHEERARVVGAAIAQLPNKRREVFTLAYLDGLSYKEVAEVLGVSPATVKNQVATALADLRASLASERAR